MKAMKIALAGFVLSLVATAAAADERHEGYYYPEISSTEEYVSRAAKLEDSSRSRRIGFVTGLTKFIYDQPYPPQFAIFAKGEDAEKLIVVATGDGQFNTIYRARALFASLTALARLSPLFREFAVEEYFTFFDLAKLLGFTQITVSDGDTFAHRIEIR
ncbi:MAG TPA: molybdopterin-guanine dinucleotide biosynthesis protein A [Alphaproteobacteria bacterium]|nr:molybdopterin-guanine dinucleotide biosynthesis protein A [Alphaproteobacteria bacterium]